MTETKSTKAQWEINQDIRDAYYARMRAWTATLKPGDRVGLTDSIFVESRGLALFGTVQSVSRTGRLNVVQEGGTYVWAYLSNGPGNSKHSRLFLEEPEQIMELARRTAERARATIEHRARRAAWVEEVGWNSETSNHFRRFISAMDAASGITPEIRTHGAEIFRLLDILGLAQPPTSPRSALESPAPGDTKTWTDEEGEVVQVRVHKVHYQDGWLDGVTVVYLQGPAGSTQWSTDDWARRLECAVWSCAEASS